VSRYSGASSSGSVDGAHERLDAGAGGLAGDGDDERDVDAPVVEQPVLEPNVPESGAIGQSASPLIHGEQQAAIRRASATLSDARNMPHPFIHSTV
jgi:hypothetical protein